MKIAIQGTRASFHDQAARKFFDPEIELVECRTFENVCQAKADNECNFAILAIENTLTGSFLPNYNLLQKYGLKIIGEVYLQIEQNLMCLPGRSINDLKYVRSHPIALLQCSEYLEQHPHLIPIETFDTAGSAREIRDENMQDTAAIAGRMAAEVFGLEIIAWDIENLKNNHTRFLILDGKERIPDIPDKASLSFTLPHKVGSLADTLKVFQDHRINLTKIQSVPILGKPYEYQFHVDLEWEDSGDYESAMHAIKKYTDIIEILGQYKRGEKTIYRSDEVKITKQ